MKQSTAADASAERCATRRPFELGEVVACNCSRCGRLGSLLAFMPKDSLSFSPARRDDRYQFNKHNIHHLFCATCGIQSYAHGKVRAAPRWRR